MNGQSASDYDFELPHELIAQRPLERRDASRLMIVDRAAGSIRHGAFTDIVELLAPRDVLVVNRSRVLRARLLGTRASGAPAEILLLKPLGDGRYQVGAVTIGVRADSASPIVRTNGGRQELLVPVTLKDGKAEVVQEIGW